nr:hypothetical protein [Tanacetum cinerariifolium]
MIFADDIVLIAESEERLNNRLESWRKTLEDNGLRVSREKSEYLRCDFGRYEVVHQEMDIRIRDQILQPKESFRYLGLVLHRSGRIVDDVAHRIRAGSRRRGRPKLRWEDRLKMDMKELCLSEDMTSDRNTWRDRIRISRRPPFALSLGLLCACSCLPLGWRLVCLPRVYDDVGCLLALVLFHALPLSISLMHTYTAGGPLESVSLLLGLSWK